MQKMRTKQDNSLISTDRESIYRAIIVICKILSIYDYAIGYDENKVPTTITATATGEVAGLPSKLPDLLKSLEDLLDQAVIYDKIFRSSRTVKPLGLDVGNFCPPLPNRAGYIKCYDANTSSIRHFYATLTGHKLFLSRYRLYSNKAALFRLSSTIQTQNHIVIEFYGDYFTYHPLGGFLDTAEYGRHISYKTEEIELFFDELEFSEPDTFAKTKIATQESEADPETEVLDDILLASTESPENATTAETDEETASRQGIETAEDAGVGEELEAAEDANVVDETETTEEIKEAESPRIVDAKVIPEPTSLHFTDAQVPIPSAEQTA